MKQTSARFLLPFFASLFPLVVSLESAAQNIGQPLVLVASPELRGLYSRTAVLAVPIQSGHAGFILNRATDVSLAALFPDHAPSAKVVDPIYFGGPDMVHALFAVVRGHPGQPSVHLFGDIYVTANAETVDRIIEQTPNEARYYAGFVRWAPGELAKELQAGYWYTGDADAELIFSKEPAAMWEQLLERLGSQPAPARGSRSARLGPGSVFN